MASKRKVLMIGAVLLAIAMVPAIIYGGENEDPEAYAWDRVSRGDIRETISVSGEIRAKSKVNIGTMVSGEIKTIHVRDGQDVKAGDLLVTIDQEQIQQDLTRSEAALDAFRKDSERAQTVMESEQTSFHRMESLHKQGLVSDEEHRRAKVAFDSARLSYQSSKANVAQNQAAVASQKTSLGKAVLRAPMAGRVTGLKAEKGETAIAGMTNLPGAVLMVISDMSEILTEIKVNESEVVRIKPGQTAQVSLESLPGRAFQGKVVEVAAAADRQGQETTFYVVKILLDPKGTGFSDLRPGMNARAVILTAERKNALRVPLQAVLEREGSAEEAQKKGMLAPENRMVVLQPQRDSARETVITTGIANTQYYEVLGGLKEGDTIITGPIRKLKDLKEKTPLTLRKKSDSESGKSDPKPKA